MEYWRLSRECLITLYNNWASFYNECINSLNIITDSTLASYEIQYQKYRTVKAEIEYQKKRHELVNWRNSKYYNLKIKHQKFLIFYKTVCEQIFTSSDFGYIIKINFHSFEIEREYDYSLPAYNFRVKFIGQNQWYEYNYHRREMHFDSGKPELVKYNY